MLTIINMPASLSFTIFWTAVSVCFLPLKKAKTITTFDIEFTNIVKGFAMFLILYHHTRIYHPQEFWFLFCGGEFYSGVSLFFFISGIGLSKSINRKHYSFIGFLKKRFVTIFTGTAICIYLRNLTSFLWGGQFSMTLPFTVLLGFHEWYIVAILTWYMLFIIIMKTKTNNYELLFFTTIAAFSAWVPLAHFTDQYPMARLWSRFPFSFALGIAAADHIDQIISLIGEHAAKVFIICMIPITLLVANGTSHYPYTIAMDCLSIPLALSLCCYIYKTQLNKSILITIGKISLPVYLLQVVMLQNNIFYTYTGYNALSLLLTWVTIIILSLAADFIHKTALRTLKI
jgi:peptidoglycan/LPS O-acetylase OafA/YrhL